jgi:hypothetical protein
MARISGTSRRLLITAILVGSAAFATATDALACGSNGYTYAGLASPAMTHGVGARLTAIGAPSVANGHVAGWVGVGGPGQGPNGKDEWIQVGFSGFAGSPQSDLYYEVTRAGSAPRYVEIQHSLPPGTSRRVAVLEVGGQPNAWRVWVNGKPVSKAIYLPSSHGTWRGIATAESWTNSGKAACNGFGYRFDDIQIAQQAGGSWRSLANALPIRTGVNKLFRPTAASFEATAGPLLKLTPLLTKPKHKAPPTYIAGTMARSLTAATHTAPRAQQ